MAGRVEQVDNLSLAAGLATKLRRGLPGAKTRPAETARADGARATSPQAAASEPVQRPCLRNRRC